MGKQRLTKQERLLKKRQFDLVFSEGRAFRNREVVLYALPNQQRASRIGLVVSRKFGNAVKRNRMKRLLREVFRLNKEMLSVKSDLIFIPRAEANGISFHALQSSVRSLFARAQRAFTRDSSSKQRRKTPR